MFYSSDDTYPVFEEMIKKKMDVHYLDGKEFIYKKFCEHEKYCLKVLHIIKVFMFIKNNNQKKKLIIYFDLIKK
jgi:hypothetical protein